MRCKPMADPIRKKLDIGKERDGDMDDWTIGSRLSENKEWSSNGKLAEAFVWFSCQHSYTCVEAKGRVESRRVDPTMGRTVVVAAVAAAAA